MKKYIKFFLLIFIILVGVKTANAQPIALTNNESHTYTFSVKEDGSADVWLRIDGATIGNKGQKYNLELPKGAEPKEAWYKENDGGCILPLEATGAVNDQMFPCRQNNSWEQATIYQDSSNKSGKITVSIPGLKNVTNQPSRVVSIGMTWKMANITVKKWWGREVMIGSAKSESYISFEQIAVDLPSGVFIREKQIKPTAWGDIKSINASVSSPQGAFTSIATFSPSMFDNVGVGQITKVKDNLQPGTNYSFVLQTSTSMWTLYLHEIGIMIGAVMVLVVVASILLRLIFGRKPLQWYMVVIFLVIVLIAIVIGMFTMYRALFYGNNPPAIPVN